jgi:hypothetical protein
VEEVGFAKGWVSPLQQADSLPPKLVLLLDIIPDFGDQTEYAKALPWSSQVSVGQDGEANSILKNIEG